MHEPYRKNFAIMAKNKFPYRVRELYKKFRKFIIKNFMKALDWLQEVGIVTERLLAAMIGCFSSHYGKLWAKSNWKLIELKIQGSVRKKICETVGELELAEAEVIQQLILLIKREAISKIKQAAIHALGTALF